MPHKKRKGHKLQTRIPLLTLSGHTEGVSAVTWLQEQEVCTASWDHTIRLWDLELASQKSSLVRPVKVFSMLMPARDIGTCTLHMGPDVRKLVFRDLQTTQVQTRLSHPHSLISAFVIRFLESIIM